MAIEYTPSDTISIPNSMNSIFIGHIGIVDVENIHNAKKTNSIAMVIAGATMEGPFPMGSPHLHRCHAYITIVDRPGGFISDAVQ